MSLCPGRRLTTDGVHQWDNISIQCQLDEGHEGPHESATYRLIYSWHEKDYHAKVREHATR